MPAGPLRSRGNAARRVAVTAPAKVNLCLHVGDRRADGYHDLESLCAFVSCADSVRIERDDSFSLAVAGSFAGLLPAGEDNLALHAARLLAKNSGVREGARITLEKVIPVAAGLGGGSADAAAVLRGLNTLWKLDLAGDALREIAAAAGADVPVCIDSGPAWMEGRGERITPLPPLPQMWLLLVNPRVPIETAQVFAGLHQRSGLGVPCPETPFEDLRALLHFLHSSANDLEEPARAIAPVIDEVLHEIRRLPQQLFTRMSGSGATCFGIFANHDAVCSAADSLQETHPCWWHAATAVAPATIGTPQTA